jgi:predicted ribonuclease toxin of YeeF-YezG toxin-antitoxin module
MKKYTGNCLYKGQQIEMVFWAKSDKEAAELMNTSVYEIRSYYYKSKDGEYFRGIKASFESGMLLRKAPHLIRKVMSFDELKKIIDIYNEPLKITRKNHPHGRPL